MIEEVLAAATIPGWPSRCPDPPDGTYAIYFDTVSADGPDNANRIFTHDAIIELYEPKQDAVAEYSLEGALDNRGLHWTKQSRYWLQNIQRYQVIYEFTYMTKN